jgi:OFA family oxalate/formate antiporter-like MFS transporter
MTAGGPDAGIDGRRLAGALVLAVALGSLHAYSVLLGPLETELGTGRATTASAYSAAIVSLTLAVLVSPLVIARLGASGTALLSGGLAAAGLAASAAGGSGIALIAGLGVLFGFANGIGYALFLERSAAAMPRSRGLALGIATAAYGLGAMLFSVVLDASARAWSARGALLLLSGTVLAAGMLAASAFLGTGRRSHDTPPSTRAPAAGMLLLWLVYLLGATGGLMAIGHAAGILASRGGDSAMLALAPVLLAVGNILGSIAGGWRAEAFSGRAGFAGLSALSCAALLTTLAEPFALLVVGAAYGALIAFVPAYIARIHGPERSGHVFGRVFTAWGAAGLIGPWGAGLIFDASGDYAPALVLAALLAAAGALLSLAVREGV